MNAVLQPIDRIKDLIELSLKNLNSRVWRRDCSASTRPFSNSEGRILFPGRDFVDVVDQPSIRYFQERRDIPGIPKSPKCLSEFVRRLGKFECYTQTAAISLRLIFWGTHKVILLTANVNHAYRLYAKQYAFHSIRLTLFGLSQDQRQEAITPASAPIIAVHIQAEPAKLPSPRCATTGTSVTTDSLHRKRTAVNSLYSSHSTRVGHCR